MSRSGWPARTHAGHANAVIVGGLPTRLPSHTAPASLPLPACPPARLPTRRGPLVGPWDLGVPGAVWAVAWTGGSSQDDGDGVWGVPASKHVSASHGVPRRPSLGVEGPLPYCNLGCLRDVVRYSGHLILEERVVPCRRRWAVKGWEYCRGIMGHQPSEVF